MSYLLSSGTELRSKLTAHALLEEQMKVIYLYYLHSFSAMHLFIGNLSYHGYIYHSNLFFLKALSINVIILPAYNFFC